MSTQPTCTRQGIRLPRALLLSAASLLGACASHTAQAANLFWDVNGTTPGLGGTGNWNTTDANWFNAGTATTPTGTDPSAAYTFTSSDVAYFTGAGGTVTLTENTSLYGLNFSNSDFTIAGSSTLTLRGDESLGAVSVEGGRTATISTPLIFAGYDYFKFGPGKLILANTTTASNNNITVSGGTLEIGNGGTQGQIAGTSTSISFYGSTLRYNRSDDITLNVNLIANNSAWFVKAGSGKLTINTYHGDNYGSRFNVEAGTLFFDASVEGEYFAIPFSDVPPEFNISSNSTLQFTQGTLTPIYDFSFRGGYGNVYDLGRGEYGIIETGAPSVSLLGAGSVLRFETNGGTFAKGNAIQTLNLAGGDVSTPLATNTTDVSLLITKALNVTGDATISASNFALSDLYHVRYLNTNIPITVNPGTTLTISGNLIDFDAAAAYRGRKTFLTNFNKLGAGTMILSGNNTHSGKNTISAGTLQVGAGGTTGTLGTGNVSIASGGTLVFNRSDSNTVSNVISGLGAVNKIGTGTTILTGNNTFTGTTTIAGGTLQIGDGGTTGSLGNGAVTVSSGATLAFSRSDSVALGFSISGAGNLLKLGAGTTSLTGTNTYTGTTTISAGTLQIGDGGTTGSLGTGTVSIANGATLAFNRSDSITFVDAFTGAGGLTQRGASTITLTGSNTYTGFTTVEGGRLQILATNASSNVLNDLSSIRFNNAGTFEYHGFTSGSTENVGALTLAYGQGQVLVSPGTSGTTTLRFASLTRSTGATVSFVTGVGAGVQFVTPPAGSNGSIGGFATIEDLATGSADFVAGTTANTNLVALGSTTPLPVVGGSAAGNYLATSNITTTGAVSANTLRIAGGNVTLGGGLTISASSAEEIGGILHVNSNGAATISGNFDITTSVNNQELIIITAGNNAANALTISANLNLGTGTFTKSGNGRLIYTGTSNHTGATYIAGGVLQIGAGGTAGTLGTGGVNLSGGATLVLNRSDSVSLSNIISGDGSFSKLGSGTTTLTGSNTYSGATTISGGTLQIGNGGTAGTLGAGAISVSSGASLVFNRSDAITVSNAISGTGSLSKLGANTLTLTSGVNITGTTTISGGVLEINSIDNSSLAGVISGSGALSKLGSGVLTISANNTYTGGTTISAGTLQVGNGGSSGTLGAGSVSVASGATLVYIRSDSYTVSNSISGAGGLTKRGAGTITLNGTNTYSGYTTIDAGTVIIGATAATSNVLNNTSGIRFNDSAKLEYRGTNTPNGANSINNREDVGPLDLTSGQATVDITSGAGSRALLVFASLESRSEGATLNIEFNPTGGDSISFGSTPGQTNGIFGGYFTLHNTNTGVVDFAVWDGNNSLVVQRVSNLILPSLPTSGGIVSQSYLMNSSTTTTADVGANSLRITGGNLTLGGDLTINSQGGILHQNSTGASTISGNFAITTSSANQELIITTAGSNANNALTISANLNLGTGSFTKAGSGRLFYTGTSNHTGATYIPAGTLQIGNGGTSGTIGTGAVSVSSGAVLAFNRSDSFTVSNDITGTGAVTKLGSGATALTGNNTYTGPTTISAGTLQIGNGDTSGTLGTGAVSVSNGATLAFNRSDSFTVSNDITGQGGFNKLGSGTISFITSKTYTGPTTISAGTLQVGNGGTSGTIGAGAVSIARGANLAFDRSDNFTFSNAISVTGSGNDAATLRKEGNGSMTLDSTVAATELAVNVLAGRLVVNGSVGDVSVARGAELGGTGTLVNIELDSGGIISPGIGIGNLNAASLILNGGSILKWEVRNSINTTGTGYDTFNLTGNLDLSGASAQNKITLKVISFDAGGGVGNPSNLSLDLAHGYTFALGSIGGLNLASNTNITDVFAFDTSDFTYQDGRATLTAYWSIDYNSMNGMIVLTAIPEPSTYALSIGALALAAAAIRRRKKKATLAV